MSNLLQLKLSRMSGGVLGTTLALDNVRSIQSKVTSSATAVLITATKNLATSFKAFDIGSNLYRLHVEFEVGKVGSERNEFFFNYDFEIKKYADFRRANYTWFIDIHNELRKLVLEEPVSIAEIQEVDSILQLNKLYALLNRLNHLVGEGKSMRFSLYLRKGTENITKEFTLD